ncbi:hypothetical protein [Butyrivibrio sp. INlla16]|uniref:hypothetical protein n=1 Tax=Butyrivibrio sp. INlla16 TaxID=1520807 RepID=UPI00088CDCEA|nr:hypothetical protein [Butyrivibrio sp. INlla16]SDB13633.1 antitoxin Phd [Butyrivibrio sp. INlla16]
MNIDTKTLVSITDVNHNFSRVTKIVEEHGSALILKNNAPKYLMLDLTTVDDKAVESIMKKASVGKKSSK